ncbi:MAG TPA: NAD-dependent epimerase/dehydratase family protein [Xanthobacteraceae bacterium]|jgi:predicted dehydrogenase/nucleoside-diphosphate-sugar epimerase
MRYLILGGGSVITEYYLPALRFIGRLAETTVVDPDAQARKPARDEFAAVDFRAERYADFLQAQPAQAGEPNCVIVALPNHLHVEAVQAVLAQQRHVLCEKPLALRAADCATLRALAAEQKCLLKVAMSRRYLPSWMLARDMVAAKELGEVRAIQIRDCVPFLWRPHSFAFFARQAGGVLADMGVHYLDYLDTIVGALTPVAYSDDAMGGTESSLDYSLAAGDIRIGMRLSRLHQGDAYIKIACERGEIRINKQNENEVIVTPPASFSRRVSADDPFDDPAWPSNFSGSFCQMLADMERAVSGYATRIADAADAERAAALIEWAYERRQQTSALPRSEPSPSGSKVLVTGGTGFIGGHVVERLSLAGDHIRVAARTPGKCANVSRFPVELVPTDLLDKESVRAAVEGARFVYHLAYGNDGSDPARITIDGTKNVVDAAIAAGVECVVVLSTMYVFGFPQNGKAVDETFPYRPYGGEYGRSKAAMEQWCLARAQSSLPTRIVVLNPTCVFGPGGGAYTGLPVELACQGQFSWIDDGTGLCNYNYVENLVDAIMAATRITAAHGNRFIINDGAISWREFLEPMIRPFAVDDIASYTAAQLKHLPRHGAPFRIADLVAATVSAREVRTAAKRSKTIRTLASFARAMRSSDNALTHGGSTGQFRNGDAERRFPPEWLADLYVPAHTAFSAEKANNILQWRPAIDLANAMNKTVDWLIETRPKAGRPETG